jgi:acyl carrier protein
MTSCALRLLEIVRELGRRPPEGLDDTWRQLGIDSLDLLVLVTHVEDEFGVALSDPAVAGAATVGELVAAVDRLRDDPTGGTATSAGGPAAP